MCYLCEGESIRCSDGPEGAIAANVHGDIPGFRSRLVVRTVGSSTLLAAPHPTSPYPSNSLNLSTASTGQHPIAAAASRMRESHLVRMFPEADDAACAGFVRVINRSTEVGEVLIAAADDTGWRPPDFVLAIGSGETAHYGRGRVVVGPLEVQVVRSALRPKPSARLFCWITACKRREHLSCSEGKYQM